MATFTYTARAFNGDLRTATIDAASQLVHAAGSATLAEVERALAAAGLSLALGPDAPALTTTVDAWIAGGAHGAPDPWLDPVDHLVAGFTATIASGAATLSAISTANAERTTPLMNDLPRSRSTVKASHPRTAISHAMKTRG